MTESVYYAKLNKNVGYSILVECVSIIYQNELLCFFFFCTTCPNKKFKNMNLVPMFQCTRPNFCPLKYFVQQ